MCSDEEKKTEGKYQFDFEAKNKKKWMGKWIGKKEKRHYLMRSNCRSDSDDMKSSLSWEPY